MYYVLNVLLEDTRQEYGTNPYYKCGFSDFDDNPITRTNMYVKMC